MKKLTFKIDQGSTERFPQRFNAAPRKRLSATFIFILGLFILPSISNSPFTHLNAGEQNNLKLLTKAEKIINSVLSPEVEVKRNEFKIPVTFKKSLEGQVKQDFYRDSVTFWEIRRDENIVGYAMMDDVLGKMMPITFLVIFEPDGHISYCKVIKYRERWGKGIKNKRWLKQFRKKNAGSGFTVEKDIDGISGATISVDSITMGIEKLAHLMTHVISEKKVDISAKNH